MIQLLPVMQHDHRGKAVCLVLPYWRGCSLQEGVLSSVAYLPPLLANHKLKSRLDATTNRDMICSTHGRIGDWAHSKNQYVNSYEVRAENGLED